MKKASLVATVFIGILACTASVHAQAAGERIQDFSASVTINPDASLSVRESIAYDFGGDERHGIYRDIPVSYKTSRGDVSIGLNSIVVTDQNGVAYPFTVSRSGSNEDIMIGDPNQVISGVHTYTISYHVSHAISYFKTYDELYWNVTGNGWQVPIEHASVQVVLPQTVASSSLKTSCYEGAYGSSESCLIAPAAQRVLFDTARPLNPGEGLTFAVGFPKGLVAQPKPWQDFVQFILDNWVVGVPGIVLLGMTWLWLVKGRDPRGRGTIVPEYNAPDNLTPLEMAVVLHEGGNIKKSISAEIIFLATQGHLKLEKLHEKFLFLSHTDYRLDRLESGAELSAADQKLMGALFAGGESVALSDLKNKFYSAVPTIQTAANTSVVAKGYFPVNPSTVRALYVGAGAAVLLGGLALGMTLQNVAMLVSIMISGMIIVLFGLIMPRTTKAGAIIRERIKGLKLYLEVAEKDRIEFHDAPEKNPQLFEKLLPYAMVLGVEKQWATQFEGIYTQPPAWYGDPQLGAFNAALFANSLHSFDASATQTLTAAPGGGSGSIGGGFSGGGFGGGGGGSW